MTVTPRRTLPLSDATRPRMTSVRGPCTCCPQITLEARSPTTRASQHSTVLDVLSCNPCQSGVKFGDSRPSDGGTLLRPCPARSQLANLREGFIRRNPREERDEPTLAPLPTRS